MPRNAAGWPPGRVRSDEIYDDPEARVEVTLQRVTLLNAHLVCLYAAVYTRQRTMFQKMVVTPADLITANDLDDTQLSYIDARIHALILATCSRTFQQTAPSMLDREYQIQQIPVEISTVVESFRLLAMILRHPDPELFHLADLYVRSCKTFEDHNYSLCLVMAWAIIEKLLQRRWQDHIDSNRERQIDGVKVPFINVERKDKLTQSRDFGASVISEVLPLVGSLPFKLYQDLETTRKARNYWLHGLRPISWQESVGAIGVAQEMLTLVYGINLYVSMVRHWHA